MFGNHYEVKTMPNIVEITVGVARSFNLGNYENVKIEVSCRAARASDADTNEDVRKAALDELADLFADVYAEHFPKGKRSER
jgi:hypothetical protein